MRLIEINDRCGKVIYITNERWGHISRKHPSIANKIKEVEDIVKNPEIMRFSEYDKNVKFYFRTCKDMKSEAQYIIIIVKYLNGEGFIITSFYTNKILGRKNE